MIIRDLTPKLINAATRSPAITLTGPRQSGKTTLCRAVFSRHPYVTLEAPDDRAFALDDPRGFLNQFPEGAIIDEVQRAPDLLSYLQGIIDEDAQPGRWILSGSQNLSLLGSVSQSLAGRTEVHHLLPLTWGEISRFDSPPGDLEETLYAGGYPRIFDHNLIPENWLRSYVATYLERDVRTLSNIGDLVMFQRFVELCAGRTAQLLNYSSLANDCGISQPSAKAWLSILEASFVAFRLPAFHGNLRKRLVKMPKLYFYDTGLVCWLLGIRQPEQLRSHPLRGAIFESWVVSEILKHRINRGERGGLYFYRDRNGAEVDLVIERPDGLTLVEAKSTMTASSTLFNGARRVRRHFDGVSQSCKVVVAYGGEQFQQREDGRLVPWRMLRAASLLNSEFIVSVFADGRPVANASVLVLMTNKARQRVVTDKNGEAMPNLYSVHIPMTVYVAMEGFTAHVERDWVPAECTLHIELKALPNGSGAVFFENGQGRIPGLTGRLNPIRDSQDRLHLYADNISVNDGERQPVPFVIGEELRATDTDGKEKRLRVVDVTGRSALVEYHSIREWKESGH